MGYVYLIEDSTNDVYKIGVTRSNSKRRLQKLQTGNSTPLQIKYLFETEYPFRLESMLHNKYQQYKVLNEWSKTVVSKQEVIPTPAVVRNLTCSLAGVNSAAK